MIYILLLCQFIQPQKCHQEINHNDKTADNPHTAILYGNSSLGYYYMHIYVGKNRTKHSVIIDTGSQTTTINCNQCTQCGRHLNPPYQFDENNFDSYDLRKEYNCSSFQQHRCNFASYYVEGSSIGGFYFKDKVLIGDGLIELDDSYIGQESFESILGCTLFESGQLYSQLADGIFGLAPITNKTQYPPNLIDFLVKSDKATQMKRCFSICLNDNNGYFSVGGYDYYRQDTKYTKKIIKFKPNSQYQINLTKIAFGDQIFSIDDTLYTQGQGSFIDSGATISYMDQNIFDQFMKAIQNYFQLNQTPFYIQTNRQICFKFTQNISTSDSYSYFPKIKFVFDDEVEIFWKPQNYLNINNEQLCIGIEQLSNRIILGQNWMRKKDILFDLEQQEISVVSGDCALDQLKLQVVISSSEEISNELQEHQVLSNIRLPSQLHSNLNELKEENKLPNVSDNIQEDSNKLQIEGRNEDQQQGHSWSEILFYIFIVAMTLKGLLFLGLYIMKKLGGNLYNYEQKGENFQKLKNLRDLDLAENDGKQSTEHQIEFII